MRGIASSLFVFLVALGFQVSGYQSVPLAVGLWGIAGVVAAWEFSTWTPIRRRLIRVSRIYPMISLMTAIAIGAGTGGIAFGLIWHFASQEPQNNLEEKLTDIGRPITPEKSEPAIPKSQGIEQSSKGANSPNVIGNHNVVTINPESDKKLDEIKDLLKGQGEAVSREKLLAIYPLGYVIFELDYENRVFPYQSQSILDKYEINWSAVKFTVNTPTRVEIRLPDLKLKDGGGGVTDVRTGGTKKVGNLGGASVGELTVWGEILAISDKGIVFLVGFERSPQFHKP